MNKKVVWITGASSGIGFQVAKDFLKLGAKVSAHYNENSLGIKKSSFIINETVLFEIIFNRLFLVSSLIFLPKLIIEILSHKFSASSK